MTLTKPADKPGRATEALVRLAVKGRRIRQRNAVLSVICEIKEALIAPVILV